jgi:hypothetical protein
LGSRLTTPLSRYGLGCPRHRALVDGETNDVWTQGLVARYSVSNGRMRYGPVLHGSARTTAAVREQNKIGKRAEELSPGAMKSIRTAQPSGPNADLWATGRRDQRSRGRRLSIEEEAIAVAFRRHTLLPLNDRLYALQATIPHLTRSSVHRWFQRHGISRLPDVEGDKPSRASSAATDRLHRRRHRRRPH